MIIAHAAITNAQVVQTFYMTTGLNNSGGPLADYTQDFDWRSSFDPVNIPFNYAYVINQNYHNDFVEHNICGKPIVPAILCSNPMDISTCGGTPNYLPAISGGPVCYFRYRFNTSSFWTSNRCLKQVKLTISYLNVAEYNEINTIYLNNAAQTNYTVASPTFSYYSPLQNTTITIPANLLVQGDNYLDFPVFVPYNPSHTSVVPQKPIGMTFCGKLELTYYNTPNPVITGPTSVCSGGAITVDASASTGDFPNYHWEIYESDALGNWNNGNYYWDQTAGPPGLYTLQPSDYTCGGYWTFKLVYTHPCTGQPASIQHTVQVNCSPIIGVNPPGPNAISNIVYANPGPPGLYCITLNAYPDPNAPNSANYTYDWWDGGVPYIIGQGPPVLANGPLLSNICMPVNSSGYYCVTAKDPSNGCTTTRCIQVRFKTPPSATFSVSVENAGTNFGVKALCSETEVVWNNFEHKWLIEEVTEDQEVITTFDGGECWNSISPSEEQWFQGLDADAGVVNADCTPNEGVFASGHLYRITRSVREDEGPWFSYSLLVMEDRSGNIVTRPVPTHSTQNHTDQTAPMLGITSSGSDDMFTVYPIPSNGMIYIRTLPEYSTNGKIRISDLTGRTLLTVHLNSGLNNTTVDLSALENGIYLVNMEVNGKTMQSCRMILNK